LSRDHTVSRSLEKTVHEPMVTGRDCPLLLTSQSLCYALQQTAQTYPVDWLTMAPVSYMLLSTTYQQKRTDISQLQRRIALNSSYTAMMDQNP
jgi:hypothetical protein